MSLSSRMRCRALIWLASLICNAVGECSQEPIELNQNFKVIGKTFPVATNQSVEQFYNLTDKSYGGSLGLISQNMLVLIHQDSTTCDLSLVVTNDKPSWKNSNDS
jgi:hypothetical protein